MIRPTLRICRRPPELQAAKARAFSSGTPSSRRALANDTYDRGGTVALGKHGKRWKDWEKTREKRVFFMAVCFMMLHNFFEWDN